MSARGITRFNLEPAALVGFVSALVATLVSFQLGLTTETGALVVAMVEAGLGVYLALSVRETLFAAITQAAKAALALLVGFGLHISEQQSLLLVALVGTFVAFFVQRPQMTPEAGSPSALGTAV